ncbi:helix-turn-helix domain-containing protein [Clostridium botulinum]|uniref:helix-turn-helix domain-containing protein n=1 Tax=Clostridium botulinum TaxID=1491 RepID=UPI001E5DD397|nr:helix-turn-helix transcriptional regulator [Clostridium botulinum]MCD3223817.1 helix-turn-helix transcriptional regulator [Clostridium botulinum C/D]MCD3295283.1 helix-turn-helix transcriptional regulator [Clostridium botulinum C/D]
MEKGLRLKELRKNLNLTQQDFAKKLNMSRSNIGNIENGIINLSERNIKDICKIFNVNEDWLKTGNGEMFVTLQEDKELLDFVINVMANKDEFIKKTFLTLARLSEEEWAVVKKIMKSLQEE